MLLLVVRGLLHGIESFCCQIRTDVEGTVDALNAIKRRAMET